MWDAPAAGPRAADLRRGLRPLRSPVATGDSLRRAATAGGPGVPTRVPAACVPLLLSSGLAVHGWYGARSPRATRCGEPPLVVAPASLPVFR